MITVQMNSVAGLKSTFSFYLNRNCARKMKLGLHRKQEAWKQICSLSKFVFLPGEH